MERDAGHHESPLKQVVGVVVEGLILRLLGVLSVSLR
jgi:hypothetical protein